MTVASLLDEAILDELAGAADRGVTIRVAGFSADVEERVRQRVPGAEGFESLWTRVDPPAGRLLLVDREHTLVSVNLDVAGDDADGAVDRTALQHVDDQCSETAIWGSGRTNSLVLVLEAIFTWQLEDGGWTEEEGTREDESERGTRDSGETNGGDVTGARVGTTHSTCSPTNDTSRSTSSGAAYSTTLAWSSYSRSPASAIAGTSAWWSSLSSAETFRPPSATEPLASSAARCRSVTSSSARSARYRKMCRLRPGAIVRSTRSVEDWLLGNCSIPVYESPAP